MHSCKSRCNYRVSRLTVKGKKVKVLPETLLAGIIFDMDRAKTILGGSFVKGKI